MNNNSTNNPSDQSIKPTTSNIVLVNHWDHILARLGWRRSSHRVIPGLYSLGNPTEDSPVFVSGNYTLSFDALRSALKGINSYILVLDTKGVNVWCAAGKGTFGTDELVNRIESTRLKDVVKHRLLILPLNFTGSSTITSRSGVRREIFAFLKYPGIDVPLPLFDFTSARINAALVRYFKRKNTKTKAGMDSG